MFIRRATVSVNKRFRLRRRFRRPKPKFMKNIEFCFDASRLVTLNGSDVSEWGDESFKQRNLTQATASKQPTFTSAVSAIKNLPVVDFAGLGDPNYMRTGSFSSISQPITVFFVALRDTTAMTTSGDVFMGDDVSSPFYRLDASDKEEFCSRLIGILNVRAAVTGSWEVFSVLYDSSNSECWIDGASQVTGDAFTNGMASLSLGSSASELVNRYFDGKIATFFAISGPLSTFGRRLLERSLTRRYLN